MHLVQMIPRVNKCYGWIYGVQWSQNCTIPQDQDFKEGDFSINLLLVSEWNVPLERIYSYVGVKSRLKWHLSSFKVVWLSENYESRDVFKTWLNICGRVIAEKLADFSRWLFWKDICLKFLVDF